MRARVAFVLAILCAVPFLDLGRRVLWPPDEGRYAVIVREMVASGDYVVPTWAGRPNIDKPPLFIWAGAAASRLLGGVGEASVRLPSAAAAGLLVLSTFYLGLRLFDTATALIGAVVLSTCGRFLLYSQWCATDMMLASLSTLALAACVGGGGAPAGTERRPSVPRAGLLFMGVSALAVLTKGPVGLFLPLGIVVIDIVAAGWREPPRVIEGLRRLVVPWAAGGLVFLAVAAPWFILLYVRLGGAGLSEIFLHQNVGRFLEAWNARQPWYFYLEAFPLDFLPWSFLLPIIFSRVARTDRGRLGAWRFLRIWFLLIFVFFSTASGKSPEYLMPLLSAASLMVARLFVLAAGPAGEAGEEEVLRMRRRLLAGGAMMTSGTVIGLALLAAGKIDLLPGARPALLAATLLLTLGTAGCLAALGFGRPEAGALILAASILLVRILPARPLMDAGNGLNVAPQVGRELARVLPAGSRVGVGRKGADYILYYAGVPVVPLERPGRVVAFLEEGPPNAVVLKGREYRELADRLRPIATVAARFGDDERGFVVLRAGAE